MADEQTRAEGLDDDKLEGEEYPPDEPIGADEYGTGAQEGRWDEPIEERLAREEPELDGVGGTDEPGMVLADPDEDNRPDEEPDAVGSASEAGLEPPPGDIISGDPTTRDVATELAPERGGEEEAIHEAEPPPMGDGDGYLDDDGR